MGVKLYDLARCFTSTTGTGSFLTVGSPVSGFLGFSAAGVQDGDTVRYAIRDGANSEIGYGVWTAATNKLTRNVLKSTASDSNISLSGGAQVFITAAAEDFAAAIGSWNYWKIRARSADPDSAPYIANLQLRGTIGGSAATVSDSSASSGTSANAYTNTGWQPNNHATINGSFGSFTLGDTVQDITTHFTTAQTIAQIAFNSVASARTSCASFDVLVSNDNAVWYLLTSFDCNISTASAQTFNLPTVNLGGGSAASAGGATALSALTDVNVTEGSGINGYSLTWNNSTGKWVATNVSGGGGSTFTGLSDVSMTEGSGIDGKVPVWDNNQSLWVPGTLPAVKYTTAFRYWKIVVNEVGGNGWTNLQRIQLETTVGSSWPTTFTYDSVNFHGHASLAIWMGNSISNAEINNAEVPIDIEITFPSPQTITNLRVTTAGLFPTEIPTVITLYGSADGSTWVQQLTLAPHTLGWALSTTYDNAVTPVGGSLGFIGSGFTDVPSSYSGKALQVVRANSGATALEFHSMVLTDLADVNLTEGAGIDGYSLTWSNGASKWVATNVSGGGGGGGATTGELAWSAPSTSTFTTFRSGSSSAGTIANLSSSRGVRLAAPKTTTNVNSMTYAVVAVPTGGAHTPGWIATARLRRHFPLNNWGMSGMIIRDSGSGKSRMFWLGNDTTLGFNINIFSGDDTWAGVSAGAIWNDLDWWQRVWHDGTNINWQISKDGDNWETLVQESPTAYLPVSPTHVGLAINPNFGQTGHLSANSPFVMDCLSWSAVSY